MVRSMLMKKRIVLKTMRFLRSEMKIIAQIIIMVRIGSNGVRNLLHPIEGDDHSII